MSQHPLGYAVGWLHPGYVRLYSKRHHGPAMTRIGMGTSCGRKPRTTASVRRHGVKVAPACQACLANWIDRVATDAQRLPVWALMQQVLALGKEEGGEGEKTL